MAKFFINHPVMSMVISIVMVIVGALAMRAQGLGERIAQAGALAHACGRVLDHVLKDQGDEGAIAVGLHGRQGGAGVLAAVARRPSAHS